jgi:hypothetical protein
MIVTNSSFTTFAVDVVVGNTQCNIEFTDVQFCGINGTEKWAIII